MGNVMYDSTLDFGEATLASATEFPNVLDLDKTSAGRMVLDILTVGAAGGTAVAVTVQGSANGTSGWVDVGKNTFTLADLAAGKNKVAISPNGFRFLKAAITKTGTFTAGTMNAQLNTYIGK
jgi:hypothetical protein